MNKKRILLYDDFNGVFPKDKDVICTLTMQFGNPAPRHGIRIIEYETD